MAIPGPMTIIDTSHDEHYRGDLAALAFDLAEAINAELHDWVREGCDVVQIDEPAFTRYPERVRAFGLEALERCFRGLAVKRVVHVCHGYPIDGSKVRAHGYEELLPALVDSSVDAVSLECAAPRLDPAVVDLCGGKDVLFGVIDIGRHEIEDPAEIAARIREAAARIPVERLWVAPDCGLVLLDRSLARAKLAAMVEGTRRARADILGTAADPMPASMLG
jgi:5-methyltetrahydropteroyltriglutamate--homocysteine methyltransferase